MVYINDSWHTHTFEQRPRDGPIQIGHVVLRIDFQHFREGTEREIQLIKVEVQIAEVEMRQRVFRIDRHRVLEVVQGAEVVAHRLENDAAIGQQLRVLGVHAL